MKQKTAYDCSIEDSDFESLRYESITVSKSFWSKLYSELALSFMLQWQGAFSTPAYDHSGAGSLEDQIAAHDLQIYHDCVNNSLFCFGMQSETHGEADKTNIAAVKNTHRSASASCIVGQWNLSKRAQSLALPAVI